MFVPVHRNLSQTDSLVRTTGKTRLAPFFGAGFWERNHQSRDVALRYGAVAHHFVLMIGENDLLAGKCHHEPRFCFLVNIGRGW